MVVVGGVDRPCGWARLVVCRFYSKGDCIREGGGWLDYGSVGAEVDAAECFSVADRDGCLRGSGRGVCTIGANVRAAVGAPRGIGSRRKGRAEQAPPLQRGGLRRADMRPSGGDPTEKLVVNEGFEPVGGGEFDGPEGGGGAVEGEGDFEALLGERLDADDAAGFGLIGVGIGEGDDITRCHGSNREAHGAAMRVDDDGLAVDHPLAFEEPKASDDANLKKDALTAPAIADGSVCGVGAFAHVCPTERLAEMKSRKMYLKRTVTTPSKRP